MPDQPVCRPDPNRPEQVRVEGDWLLETTVATAGLGSSTDPSVERLDATAIGSLDAAGALALLRFADRLGLDHRALALKDDHRELVAAVAGTLESGEPDSEPAAARWRRFLAHVGAGMVGAADNLFKLLGFFGLTLVTLIRVLPRPRRWRVTATIHHMEQTGVDALPLTLLLSFLVGAVVAFLGATVLRDFGAELYVVDLVTIAFLREMGVLLTAILLAGRTASAFTAQIGTMKSREEIDAIRTLGMDPIELLVGPRLVALAVMLPILAACAMVAGLAGGLVVSVLSLGIPAELFITRVADMIELRHYLVGLVKAPMFAAVIALIGCLEGFKVGGTAQSVGERTTSAVVQSISLVIVIDALAAVFFMELGL